MKRQWLVLGVLAFALTGLLTPSIQADFVQCPVAVACVGPTADADVINGTEGQNDIDGLDGDDFIFAAGGDDVSLIGDLGNDIIFGGPGDDIMFGSPGNDILIPGPDVVNGNGQLADGSPGNDMFLVLASEITTCLVIYGVDGQDTVNLLGFGPYSATQPFGQPGFVENWIHVVDPITGGDILIWVEENGNGAVEVINGLPTATPTITDQTPLSCSNVL